MAMLSQLRTRDEEKRYDFSPYPNSWIQVAWSHELARGAVLPVRALGRELVLFRGEDGVASALDAYCPHLGAHLGVGGTVVGKELRCPFHGWHFDGTGACTRIPYAKKIPGRAAVGAWRLRERNGQLFVWNDSEGREPGFEVPEVPEVRSDEWTQPRYYSTTIRTRWREIVENGVDRAHFWALHQYPAPPELDFQTDGPRFTMRSRVPWRRFGVQRTVTLDLEAHGAGFSIVRGHGEAPFLVLGCPMPLDEYTVVHRQTVVVSKKMPPVLRDLLARFVGWSAMREFRRDVPVWQNKVVLARPVLCDGDGPIVRFRSWARQFEPSGPREAAAE